MTQAQQDPNTLSSADWGTLDELVNRYETAWRRGERPALAEGLPQAGALRRAALRELIHAELEIRLKAGEGARVEDYLKRFPEVVVPEEVVALLVREYDCRRRQEPHLGLEEYQRRFPQHAAALAVRLQPAPSGNAPLAQAVQTRPPSPAIASAADLVAVLADCRLLDGAQLGELRSLQAQHPDPRALAKALVQRRWLTPWQVNQVFLRRAGELRLGPYLLLDRLGEGGMGTVYRAQHSVMRRLVALKAIRRDRLASPDSVRRFYREVRALARLSHANIVLAHDAAEVDGTHFLVMEHVEGTDLARLVRAQGALPVAQACDCVRQAAVGLQHAHEQGLVHRDVKPANLLLSKEGVVKVLDLGLARLQQEAGEHTVGDLTSEGTVMGTPDYIAPEQAQESHTVDIRADVYSLGCTLYLLLTGQVPFPGGTLAQKLIRHQQANPAPVEKLRAEVPAALGEVLRKMMAKRPEDRYQTPAAVAAALLPFCPPGAVPVVVVAAVRACEPTVTLAQPAPVHVRTWARQSPRRLAGVIGGGLLLALLVFLLLRPGAGDGERGTGGWPLDNLTILPPADQTDWRPDGLVLVLGSHRGRHWGPVRAVAFSADGKYVASAGDDRFICVWDAATLDEYRVLPRQEKPVVSLTFTKDGRLLSGGQDGTIRLWDLARRKEMLKLTGHTDPVTALAVSEDGERALSGGGGGVDRTVRLWNLTGAGKEVHCFKEHPARVQSVALSPDGRRAISSSADGAVRQWDLEKGKALGMPQVIDRASLTCVGSFPGGAYVLMNTAGGGRLWSVDPVKEIAGWGVGGGATALALSFDGRRAAVGGNDGGTRIFDTKTGDLRRHVPLGMPVQALALSRDGRYVVAASGPVVRLWDVEENKEVVPRPGHHTAVHALAISQNGRHVVTGGADNTVRLWDLASHPPGEGVKRLEGHTGTVSTVVFLPDQKRVVSGSQDNTVRCWDLATEKLQRHRTLTNLLAVSPDGRLAGTQEKFATATVVAVDTAQQLQEVSFGAGHVEHLTFSPDGRLGAASDNGGRLFVWNLKGEPRVRVVGRTLLGSLAFTANSRFLLSGQSDGAVHLWDLEQPEERQKRTFSGPAAPISAVVAGPAEKLVAAAFHSGQVVVWDFASGEKLQDWQMPGAVNEVAFSPDGRHLLTANANGTVYVLRLKSSP